MLLCVSVAWVSSLDHVRPAEETPKTAAPPALEIDDDAPLLLDEPPAPTADTPPSSPHHDVDINAACYVCHVNYKADPFVQTHARTNVGCVKCHGPSRAHAADEANLTPPDVMHMLPQMTTFCYLCHPAHNASARAILRRWQERCPQKADPSRVYCTDCHGNHRLEVRTITWNKRTGELLSKARPMSVRATGDSSTPASRTNMLAEPRVRLQAPVPSDTRPAEPSTNLNSPSF